MSAWSSCLRPWLRLAAANYVRAWVRTAVKGFGAAPVGVRPAHPGAGPYVH